MTVKRRHNPHDRQLGGEVIKRPGWRRAQQSKEVDYQELPNVSGRRAGNRAAKTIRLATRRPGHGRRLHDGHAEALRLGRQKPAGGGGDPDHGGRFPERELVRASMRLIDEGNYLTHGTVSVCLIVPKRTGVLARVATPGAGLPGACHRTD